MCKKDRSPADPATAAWSARGAPLERVAAALGHPVAVFTDGAMVEPQLAEPSELLRLWSQLREPASARRVLAFLAAIVAEQDDTTVDSACGSGPGHSGDGRKT